MTLAFCAYQRDMPRQYEKTKFELPRITAAAKIWFGNCQTPIWQLPISGLAGVDNIQNTTYYE